MKRWFLIHVFKSMMSSVDHGIISKQLTFLKVKNPFWKPLSIYRFKIIYSIKHTWYMLNLAKSIKQRSSTSHFKHNHYWRCLWNTYFPIPWRPLRRKWTLTANNWNFFLSSRGITNDSFKTVSTISRSYPRILNMT